jgi:hypothetical protein
VVERRHVRRCRLAALSAALAAGMAACGGGSSRGQITYEQFDKIETGTFSAKVRELLGPPASSKDLPRGRFLFEYKLRTTVKAANGDVREEAFDCEFVFTKKSRLDSKVCVQ